MIKAQCEFECDRCHRKEVISYPFIDYKRTNETAVISFAMPRVIRLDGFISYWQHVLGADLCPDCYKALYALAHSK